jgi:hypothetical protein
VTGRAAPPPQAHPIADNPFYVLEVRPQATAMEVARAGQKLLAMLAVGLESATSHPSPFGPRPRDADRVRQALDALRDPRRRAQHEVWAALPPREIPPDTEPVPGWPEGLAALGWEPMKTR